MIELTARELLVLLYEAAVDAVDGQYLVQQWFAENGQIFSHCVAIGKAAPAMLQGAINSCSSIRQSLLISPDKPLSRVLRNNKSVNCVLSSHPLPDEKSLEAGRQLLSFLAQLPADAEVLFLISGGASSLVEVLDEDISLQQCRQINRYLLASGKSIQQINAWRQQYSKIKAGGLLRYINPAQSTQLLISDVQGDDISVIGSGLLVESVMTTDDDALLQTFFSDKKLSEQKQLLNVQIDTVIVGSLKQALAACAKAAEAEGLPCTLHEEFLAGETDSVAKRIAGYLNQASPGIYLWGGETTVTLPDNPGIGGRNQSFALTLASYLTAANIHVLAAGTDGIDGNSNCAGAAVSVYTIKKAKSMGLDVARELKKANAGMILIATGDLFQPGSTSTNVMDIVIAYVSEPAVQDGHLSHLSNYKS